MCEGLEPALSSDDLSTIKGMLARGDASSDIAYWFGVCEHEVERIRASGSFADAVPTEQDRLPPPGPYPSISEIAATFDAIKTAIGTLNTARVAAGLPAIKFQTSKLTVTSSRRSSPRAPEPDTPRATTQPPKTGKPRTYRPPPAGPVVPRPKETTKTESDERTRPLPLHARLLREKGGFVKVSLLPRRTAECPSNAYANISNQTLQLRELNDEWYDEIIPEQLGTLLADGIEWSLTLENGMEVKWLLSGRSIYVLAPHDDLAGLVGAPRLLLGVEQAVLATEQTLQEALAVVRETGSPEPVVISADQGAPQGWALMLGVTPAVHVEPKGDDILDVLRPKTEIDIHLSDGVRLARADWLFGRPPRILLLGSEDPKIEVRIDNAVAAKDEAGAYTAPGWNEPGEHMVWCAGWSRTYRIVVPTDAWELWPAHDDTSTLLSNDAALCGVQLLLLPRHPGDCVIVPDSHRLVIGLEPGQIHVCPNNGSGACVALTRFPAAFALPTDTSAASKRYSNVIALERQPEQQPGEQVLYPRKGIAEWSRAILNANRKGLRIEPIDALSRELWKRCTSRAQSIRKRHK